MEKDEETLDFKFILFASLSGKFSFLTKDYKDAIDMSNIVLGLFKNVLRESNPIILNFHGILGESMIEDN